MDPLLGAYGLQNARSIDSNTCCDCFTGGGSGYGQGGQDSYGQTTGSGTRGGQGLGGGSDYDQGGSGIGGGRAGAGGGYGGGSDYNQTGSGLGSGGSRQGGGGSDYDQSGSGIGGGRAGAGGGYGGGSDYNQSGGGLGGDSYSSGRQFSFVHTRVQSLLRACTTEMHAPLVTCCPLQDHRPVVYQYETIHRAISACTDTSSVHICEQGSTAIRPAQITPFSVST